MDLLLPLLFSSLAFVEGYGKSNDPNDEPFLPIYPVYPYSPKLIKRGTEKENIVELPSELHAPKVDAKDSYSASFTANHPRDPHYPNYNPYLKLSSPSSYGYYGNLPYSYPYSSPYPVPPPSYTPTPYSSSYPSYYYYQPPYYYPNDYGQPLFPPLPLPPPAADYTSDSYSESEASGNGKEKKPSVDNKYRDNDVNRFVDGGNYISENANDLDSQPSTYRTTSPRNEVEQSGALRIKNLEIPLPKTTYRVISVAGQLVGPDYPLPAPYAKAQQLEEIMNHAWAKLLVQNLQQVVAPSSELETLQSSANGGDVGQYANQSDRNKDTRHVSVPNAIAKAGFTYVLHPSLLDKLSIGQTTGQTTRIHATRLKTVKQPAVIAGTYSAIEKSERDQAESSEYENYANSSSESSQDSEGSANQADNRQQNYHNDPGQSYRNEDYHTAETPQAYSYQYANYNPSQSVAQQQYKNNLEDVNFSAKTKKG